MVYSTRLKLKSNNDNEVDKNFLKFITEGMIDLLNKDESKGQFLKFSDFMNNIKRIHTVI